MTRDRISTEGQATEGVSLDAQQTKIQAWCLANDVELGNVFIDAGLSGSRAAGVDLKVIQKRLGHRDFATTANIYSHLLQGAENDAVLKVDAFMRQRVEKVAEQPAE